MGNNKSKSNDDIHKHYEIKNKLGSGSFAIVKEAIRKKDGIKVAVKIIKKGKLKPEELAVVHDEVEVMQKIDHPHCVKLIDVFDNDKKLYLVLELLTGGELFDRVVSKGFFSEKEAANLIRDVASAIKYLHGINIVHRDLKPENLLYLSPSHDSPIKITDFGLAKIRDPKKPMTTACGTPGYVAPEVLKGEPYGPAVDLWSLGVILYILLCGFPPFYNENTSALYRQIKRGEYDFPDPYWTEISQDAKDLVKKLLTVDPTKRLTADGVLSHPWLGGASDKKFHGSHNERLKLTQARAKLRKGVQLVIALNKFSSVVAKHAGRKEDSKQN